MSTFTVYVKLVEDQGPALAVEVEAGDTVGVLLGKTAKLLRVDPQEVGLHHDGVALNELSEKVTQTTLGEGSEVEVRQSKAVAARITLQELGMGWKGRDMDKVVTMVGREDDEKAGLVQLMLDADPEGVDTASALCSASRMGALQTVQVLSVRGVTTCNSYGVFPLHCAAVHNHLSVVQHLLACGANPNTRYDEGYTPLHLAALSGYLDVAKSLAMNGADPTARTNKGDTPLRLAKTGGHPPVAAYLKSLK